MGLRITALLPILAFVGLSCQLEGRPRDESRVAAADGEPALAHAPSEQGGIALDIWPSHTGIMAGLDVAAINESPLGDMFNALIRNGGTGLLPTKTACQRKLVDAIDTMLFIQGFTGAMNKSVLVIRGMKRSDVEQCVAAEATGAAQNFGANYGALEDDLEKYLIWWHDAETFLLSPDGGKVAIDIARPDKLRAPTNPELLKSIARVDTSAALWVAAVELPAGMSKSVGEFRGSIHLKDSLNATFRVQYDNADSASAAVKDVEIALKSLTQIAKYFEESRVRAEGSLLKFDLSMTRSRVAAFANGPMFKGMF